jgi:hypothetical protein
LIFTFFISFLFLEKDREHEKKLSSAPSR